MRNTYSLLTKSSHYVIILQKGHGNKINFQLENPKRPFKILWEFKSSLSMLKVFNALLILNFVSNWNFAKFVLNWKKNKTFFLWLLSKETNFIDTLLIYVVNIMCSRYFCVFFFLFLEVSENCICSHNLVCILF